MAGIPLKVTILVLSISFIVASHLFCTQQWSMVATGTMHTVGLMANGSLYSWGTGRHGNLGVPRSSLKNDQLLTPHPVMPQETFKFVEASFAITIDGRLFAWGWNEDGQLGIGSKEDQFTPVQVGKDSDWMMISSRYYHTLALKKNGQLYAWGKGQDGQLGNGKTEAALTPVQIMSNTTWKSISTGFDTSYAIRNDGALFAWGKNDNGQLGDVSTTNRLTPVQIKKSKIFSVVAAGASHVVALNTKGYIYTWGSNNHGQLGIDLENKGSSDPIYNGEIGKLKAIAAGTSFSLIINTDESLLGFGENNKRQLGNTELIDEPYPTQILSGQTWKSVSAGASHAFGVTSEGHLIGWGDGLHGQLGNGNQGYNQEKSPSRCTLIGVVMSKLLSPIKKLVNTL